MTLQAKLDKAFTRLQRGEINDAVRIYTDILGHSNQQPDALYMLGTIALKLGATDQALEFASAVTEASPRFAPGWVLQALSLRALHRNDEALTMARYAIELNPQMADAWECVGTTLMNYGKWAEARNHFERALEYISENASLHGCYALVLAEQGDLVSGWNECREALMRNPEAPMGLLAKTKILAYAGYYDLALSCRRAAARWEKIEKSLAFDESATLLVMGRFKEGYAVRADQELARIPEKTLPWWQGEDDASLHLALFTGQACDDVLQYIRFVDQAAAKVGSIVLRIPIQVERLVRSSMPHLPLSIYQPPPLSRDQSDHELNPALDFPPEANVCCSLVNLPHVLAIGANSRPNAVPYLRAEPILMAQWRGRLAKVSRPRIGLSWSCSPWNSSNSVHSIPFGTLSPLIERFAPHLVSLEIGPESKKALQAGIYDASPYIKDFADHAALLEEIDLLITVDCAPAHLAGALGRPVWVALAFNADGRWLIAREDSIWYPSAHLFRQPCPGAWNNVVHRLCDNLEKFMSGDRDVLKAPPWKNGNLTRHPQAVVLPGIEDEAGFNDVSF